mgnify:CR=1 FL=1
MKENKYDDAVFFQKYSEMSRSKYGLSGAGEWYALKKMMPDFTGKRVLDLGCGYGWHCAYAADNGAKSVLGIDISVKMLETAKHKNAREKIVYQRAAMEDLHFACSSFDCVISSLAFHSGYRFAFPQYLFLACAGRQLCFFVRASRVYGAGQSGLVL